MNEASSTANPSTVQSALRCDDADGPGFASMDAGGPRFVEAKCAGEMFGPWEPFKDTSVKGLN